jgi:hypothetical protein
MDAPQLKKVLAALPGGVPPAASALTRSSVFDAVQFNELTDDARCELAKFFILDNCPRIGAFASNGDAGFFLAHVANDLKTWPQGGGIASRRLEHVAFAISTIAGPLSFASPPGALASVYLLHQLEFMLRAISGVLDLEGKFVSPQAKVNVEQQLGVQLGARINDIGTTYNITKLNTALFAPNLFNELDAQLPQLTLPGGKVISTVGERIAYFRNPVSHGPLGDPSSEGYFYALLMTIAIYGSSLFPRV